MGQAEKEEVPLMPQLGCNRYLLEYQIRLTLYSHLDNRKICAANLLNIRLPNKIDNLNDYIIEVMFLEMLCLPARSEPLVCYTSILFELIRQRENEMTLSIYNAFKFFWNNIGDFNVNTIENLSAAFNHYLSNNDFKWAWDSYSSYCDLPESDPSGFFIRFVCANLLGLSCHERLDQEMPEESYIKTGILPIESAIDLTVNLKHLNEHKLTLDDYTAIRTLIRPKKLYDEVFPQIQALTTEPSLQLLILITLAYDFGSKSMTHFTAAITKFKSHILGLCQTPEIKSVLLKSMQSICEHHIDLLKFSIQTLYSAKIITFDDFLTHMLNVDAINQILHPQAYMWEILGNLLMLEKSKKDANFGNTLISTFDQVVAFFEKFSEKFGSDEQMVKKFKFFIESRFFVLFITQPEFIDIMPLVNTKYSTIKESVPDSTVVPFLNYFVQCLK